MAACLSIAEEDKLILVTTIKEGFKSSIEKHDIKHLVDAVKKIDGSDFEKKMRLDEIVQEFSLDKMVENVNFPVADMTSLLEIMIKAISKDCMNCSTLFGVIQDLFDISTLDTSEQLFYFVEKHIDTWKMPLFYVRGKTFLLRIVNDILKRVCNCENMKFTHRLQSFLSRLYPISEKSGLNMMGVFNVGNVTKYKHTKENYRMGHLISYVQPGEECFTDSDDEISSIADTQLTEIDQESEELFKVAVERMPSPTNFQTSDYMNGIGEIPMKTLDFSQKEFDDVMAPSSGDGNELIVIRGVHRRVLVRGWTKEFATYPVLKWKSETEPRVLEKICNPRYDQSRSKTHKRQIEFADSRRGKSSSSSDGCSGSVGREKPSSGSEKTACELAGVSYRRCRPVPVEQMPAIRVVRRGDDYFQICERPPSEDSSSSDALPMEGCDPPNCDKVLIALGKCASDECSVRAMVNENAYDDFVEFDLYSKFWRLQDYFRSPNRIPTEPIWEDFEKCICEVMKIFEEYKTKDVPISNKNEYKEFFPKFLTNEKLLDLQLNDPNFRLTIYTQMLFIFQYILSPVKFKLEEQQPNASQRTWINKKINLIYATINKNTDSGSMFTEFLKQISFQEDVWSEWKNKGCIPYIKEALEKKKYWSRTNKFIMDKAFSGSLDYQSSKTKPMNLCSGESRNFIPVPKEFFSTTLEQSEPDSGVEDQYKNLNNEVFLWKSLRLLSSHNLNFFNSPTLDETKRAVPMDTVAEKLIMKTYSLKYGVKRESSPTTNGHAKRSKIDDEGDLILTDPCELIETVKESISHEDEVKESKIANGSDEVKPVKPVESTKRSDSPQITEIAKTTAEVKTKDSKQSNDTKAKLNEKEKKDKMSPSTKRISPTKSKTTAKNGTSKPAKIKEEKKVVETNGVQSSTYKIGVRVNIKRGTKLSDTVKYDEYILVNEQITKISQLICAEKNLKWMDIASELKSHSVDPNDFKEKSTGLLFFLRELLEKSPENLSVKKLKSVFTKNNKLNILEKSMLSFV